MSRSAMLTYERLSRRPQAAKGLIGMSLAEFEQLYAKFEAVHKAHEMAMQHARRNGLERKRSVGAGRKYKHGLRSRLLMTLFWLRANTTYEVLGRLYDLNKTNIEDNLKDILESLVLIPAYHFDASGQRGSKIRSFQEMLDVFPEIHLLIDAGQPPASDK